MGVKKRAAWHDAMMREIARKSEVTFAEYVRNRAAERTCRGVYRRAEGEPASNAPVFFLSRSDTHESVDSKISHRYEA